MVIMLSAEVTVVGETELIVIAAKTVLGLRKKKINTKSSPITLWPRIYSVNLIMGPNVKEISFTTFNFIDNPNIASNRK